MDLGGNILVVCGIRQTIEHALCQERRVQFHGVGGAQGNGIARVQQDSCVRESTGVRRTTRRGDEGAATAQPVATQLPTRTSNQHLRFSAESAPNSDDPGSGRQPLHWRSALPSD